MLRAAHILMDDNLVDLIGPRLQTESLGSLRYQARKLPLEEFLLEHQTNRTCHKHLAFHVLRMFRMLLMLRMFLTFRVILMLRNFRALRIFHSLRPLHMRPELCITCKLHATLNLLFNKFPSIIRVDFLLIKLLHPSLRLYRLALCLTTRQSHRPHHRVNHRMMKILMDLVVVVVAEEIHLVVVVEVVEEIHLVAVVVEIRQATVMVVVEVILQVSRRAILDSPQVRENTNNTSKQIDNYINTPKYPYNIPRCY